METLEQIMKFTATHSLALGVGVLTGLIIENIVHPIHSLRNKLALMFGKAEETLSDD